MVGPLRGFRGVKAGPLRIKIIFYSNNFTILTKTLVRNYFLSKSVFGYFKTKKNIYIPKPDGRGIGLFVAFLVSLGRISTPN